MKNIIIYISTSMNKFNTQQICSNFAFLEDSYFNNTNISILTMNTKVVNFFKKNFKNINVIHISSKNKTLTELQNEIITCLPTQIDTILLGATQLSSVNIENFFLKEYDEIERSYFSFMYTKNIIISYLFINMINKKIIKYNKLFKFVLDPQENKICENEYYFYNSISRNTLYFPSYSYLFFFKKKRELFNIKKYTLTFGSTCVTEDRKQFSEFIIQLSEEKKFNIFYKDKFLNIDTSVDNKKYNDYLTLSKYTLILPSYEVTHFSCIRLFEALSANCIPFLYKCNIDEIKQQFPILFKILETYFIINNIEELKEKCDSYDYDKYLNQILSCDDIKKMRYTEYYTKYFKQLL